MRRAGTKGQPVTFAELAARSGTRGLLGEVVSVGRLANAWVKIVGDKLAAKTQPFRMQRQVLTIHVSDSPLLHELTFCQQELLSKIRHHLPETNVDRLKFKIGRV